MPWKALQSGTTKGSALIESYVEMSSFSRYWMVDTKDLLLVITIKYLFVEWKNRKLLYFDRKLLVSFICSCIASVISYQFLKKKITQKKHIHTFQSHTPNFSAKKILIYSIFCWICFVLVYCGEKFLKINNQLHFIKSRKWNSLQILYILNIFPPFSEWLALGFEYNIR